MKFKNLCIAASILILLILGFNMINASGTQVQPNTPAGSTAVQPNATTSGDIKIITSNTVLKIGDFGFVTIQGRPNTRYILKTNYKHGNIIKAVTQMRVSDNDGFATFNWVVQRGTTPGSNTATIDGGGSAINFTHTVTQ